MRPYFVKHINKILFSVLSVILAAVMLFATASAETVTKTVENITFSISDKFGIFTAEALESPKDVEGFVFAAISQDNAHQIQCRSTETEFSKQMESFKGLKGEDLKPVGEKIFSDGFETTEVKGDVYLKKTTVNGNDFSVVYVTVSNGKLYTFSYFGSDPTVIGEFIGTVKLPDTSHSEGPNVLIIVVLSIAILGVSAFLVILILSFIRDYRHRKMEQSENIVSNYIKIKRRKY